MKTSILLNDIRDGLTPRRVTNAMWDFSWVKMHHPGGAFESFEQSLDALVERGFNTVRIDCLPLIIGMLSEDDAAVTFSACPEDAWGFIRNDQRIAPVRALLDFMKAAQDRNVWVILSSWGIDAREFPNLRAQYTDRERFCKAWEKVLDRLEAEGLLDRVLYVDLDQEFPFYH